MFKLNVKSLRPYLPWIIIGIVVRLILSAISFHPDIWGIGLVPSLWAYHGVFNIYDYLAHIDQSSVPWVTAFSSINAQEVFIYPPLAYFTLGFAMFLLRPFYNPDFFYVIATTFQGTLGSPELTRFLILTKLPYFIFDLVSLYYLVKFFDHDEKSKKLAFFLWLCNPITIYASYMVGNFDIIPIFFTIAGTYYFSRNRLLLGFLLFGIGAAYKTYPILIALPLVFLFAQTFWQRVKYGAALVLPYILTSLPFILTSFYRVSVMFNPKNTKFLFMTLPVSGAEGVYVFIACLVLITMIAAQYKKRLEHFWVYPLAVLLIMFSVTHYHPQWMAWLTPFAIIAFVLHKATRWPILIMFFCYVGIVFSFEASLNIGIFSPIIPASQHWQGLSEILASRFDVFQLKSLLRSVFAGIAIWLVVKLLLSEKREALS